MHFVEHYARFFDLEEVCGLEFESSEDPVRLTILFRSGSKFDLTTIPANKKELSDIYIELKDQLRRLRQ